MENKYLVEIRCKTYNHEPYIRACLEGFIKQETNFPFIAIVHDDASTDGTANIIREFATKYPEKILPLYENENLWSKHDGSLQRVVEEASVGAKYIAICEGDDYWTDPYKLQKQVDFMEAHPDFSICFHPVMVFNQLTGEMTSDTLKKVPSETTIYDLAKENYIHTPSVMYRYSKEVNDKYSHIGRVGVGDYLYHMLYAEQGKIKKLPDHMAVYRQGVGIWTGPNSNGNDNSFKWIIACSKLSALLDDSRARHILDEQIYSDKNIMLDEYHAYEKQIQKILSSKAYRLGKLILKPFNFLKRHIKSR